MTQSVEDAARMLTVLAGHDDRDSTSVPARSIDYAAALGDADTPDGTPLQGVRVGLLGQTLGAGVAPEVCQAVQSTAAHLERLGATVHDVQLPSFDAGLPAYYVIALSEASSNLSRCAHGALYVAPATCRLTIGTMACGMACKLPATA